MGTIFVQFADAKNKQVVSVFGGPQNEDDHPHQGEIEENDPRYLAYLNPVEEVQEVSPVDKLKAFLTANPDVAAILK